MTPKIRELMTTTLAEVETGRPVAEAAQLMRDRNVGDVLVMNDGQLAGIVTDRDIVVRCIASEGDPSTTAVESICSGELATLTPDDDTDRAVRLMEEHAVRRLPVVENGKPVGIVSIGDLAVERDRQSALGEISAAPPNR